MNKKTDVKSKNKDEGPLEIKVLESNKTSPERDERDRLEKWQFGRRHYP